MKLFHNILLKESLEGLKNDTAAGTSLYLKILKVKIF